MREYREVRFRSNNPEEASEYLGFARTLLGQLKNEMRFAGLLQGVRRKLLPNGVRVMAMSVFGLDTIQIDIPPIPTGNEQEKVTAILIEELVAAGVSWDSDYGGLAIPLKWTPRDGLEVLPVLGGDFPHGNATCIAAHNNVIFGYCFGDYPTPNNLVYRACYWDSDGAHDLGEYGIPVAVSDNGQQVLLWRYETDDVESKATYLLDRERNELVPIAAPDGWAQMQGFGLSGAGDVAIGEAVTSGLSGYPLRSAWRWERRTGTVDLGHAAAPGTNGYTTLGGLSADGTTICGFTVGADGDYYPFTWVDGEFEALPAPESLAGRLLMQPRGISRHGRVIVGSVYSYDNDDYHGFRYYDGVTVTLPKNEEDTDQRITAQSVTKDGAYIGASYVQWSGDWYESPLVYKGDSEIVFNVSTDYYSPELDAINRRRLKVYSDGRAELVPDNEDQALSDGLNHGN